MIIKLQRECELQRPLFQETRVHRVLVRYLAIDQPFFQTIDHTNLKAEEIVFVYRHGETVKIYPQRILWDHEIVNDHIDDRYRHLGNCTPVLASLTLRTSVAM